MTFYKKLLTVFSIFTFLFSTNSVQIDIIDQNDEYIILHYSINDYLIEEVEVNNEIFHDVILLDEPNFIEKNSPKLPHVNRSFIIPNMKYAMSVNILNFEQTTLHDINIIPSKGNPPRSIDINSLII